MPSFISPPIKVRMFLVLSSFHGCISKLYSSLSIVNVFSETSVKVIFPSVIAVLNIFTVSGSVHPSTMEQNLLKSSKLMWYFELLLLSATKWNRLICCSKPSELTSKYRGSPVPELYLFAACAKGVFIRLLQQSSIFNLRFSLIHCIFY